MTNAAKSITVMIDLLNSVQFMKHWMQITQEHWEYDLRTNVRVRHCQKVTVVFVTNTYCSPPTW